jgi:RNA polymerase sigma factor (sigma-70 family)
MTVAGIAREASTDECLVAAVRRGDERAFEQLYGRYQRRISAYVYGMVNDYGRAEDITQEVFVSALRRMRATERPIAFKPWVYEIARNACIDQFRRSRRAEEVSFDAEEGVGALEAARFSNGHTPDHAMDAKQQLDDLCGAFGGLSEAHHEILVMRELEGLSYREIGERLGLSRPSVESTLFRARRRLTEEYEELISGERCRRVTAMLAAGVESLGTRDERRLAKHVAHCQPCRRQAYAAGVDAATLTRYRRVRETARRAAAILPIPAFLRLRPDAATLAEPAAGWTKAVVAAAVLVAGGAGVAAHHGAPAAPTHVAPAPAHAAPVAHKIARTHVNRTHVLRQDATRHPARPDAGSGAVARRALAPKVTRPGTTTSAPTAATHVPAGHATAPSAAQSADEGSPIDTTGVTPKQHVPVVSQTVHDIENATTKANGNVGGAVTTVANGLGLGGG